jgi:hypothetical protein
VQHQTIVVAITARGSRVQHPDVQQPFDRLGIRSREVFHNVAASVALPVYSDPQLRERHGASSARGHDGHSDRRAALLHLAGEIPAAILSDLVGVHVNTAVAWAEIAGRPWGDYPTIRGADESEPACDVQLVGDRATFNRACRS